MVMTAGEVVAQLVSQQNGEQCDRERQSREKQRRVTVSERKQLEKCVERNRLIVRVGRGKMGARE